ncbi:MAG: cation diffusion facilitator family transporter [Clostridia bacterium]|nr:cation diffusion facilitator family transporter [Clostridia bacterium]
MADNSQTSENLAETMRKRNSIIIKTSIVGIIANIFLAGFKAVVGVIANSIAVILDAVNNLTDAISSIVTIIGTKLSAKAPNKKFPLGYGRIEYISALIVAAIVFYAGGTALVESVKKIIWPETPDYSIVSIIIIAAAVLVKIGLSIFFRIQGKKVNSSALTASGADAFFDAVLSASVLLSAIVYMIWHVSLEAYVGIIISAFIIKAAIEMILDSLKDILGTRPDPELSVKIKTIITNEPEILGAYDLIINNYGTSKNYASIHIELPDNMSVAHVDKITRHLEYEVYKETGVILTGVGVYSYNTRDSVAAEMRQKITDKVMQHEWALQVHGFYVDYETKTIRFDVVIGFEITGKEAYEILQADAESLYPDYDFLIVTDVDITDI